MRWTAEIGGQPVTVRVSLDELGQVDDIHATIGPPGNSLALLLASICEAHSINLRAGVPLRNVLRGLRGYRFEPSGSTSDPLAPECTSVVDYIARAVEARATAALPRSASGS